jgi:polyribonucleotide nucleotidyltransferase
VLNEGDKVKVKVLAVDDRGKVKLSRRAVDQETGEELEVKPKGGAAAGADTDGGGRRRRRAS